MSRSYVSTIEWVLFDQVLHVTRRTLEIAWKLGVAAIAVAILFNMTTDPIARSDNAGLAGSRPVRIASVEGKADHFRIISQIPSGKSMTYLELYDPAGKHHLTIAYDESGPVYSFTASNPDFQWGSARKSGGGVGLSIRTPKVQFNVDNLPELGRSGVVVSSRDGERATLGEVWIGPDGISHPREQRVADGPTGSNSDGYSSSQCVRRDVKPVECGLVNPRRESPAGPIAPTLCTGVVGVADSLQS